jgi:arsenate reductase
MKNARFAAGLVLLHNPRCSKSRAAKALLEERGLRFSELRYLDEPLGLAELQELRRRLGRSPREWLRRTEAAYAEAGLGEASPEHDVLAAMAAHPVLIERPILVHGERAIVGRPPEQILTIL